MQLPHTPLTQHIPIDYGIIKRVDITTPDYPSSDIIIRVVWDEWTNTVNPEMESTGIKCTGGGRRTDTVIRVSVDWTFPQEIEEWVSKLGWALGAGYMYRWHKSPTISDDEHGLFTLRQFFGLPSYSFCGGEDDCLGDTDNSDLIQLAAANGYWEWEINCAYRKAEGHSSLYFGSWRKHDPTLLDDGSRDGDFPGWSGSHHFVRSTEPHTATESHFFYSRPKKYNRHTDVMVLRNGQ